MKKAILCLLLAGCSGGFHLENDVVSKSDKYYTHGTKLSVSNETEKEKTSYSLGQTIYTPSRKHADAPQETLLSDRPYAGWLYAEYRNLHQRTSTVQDVFAVQAGCVGRCSQAKEVQSFVHKVLGQNIPSWNPAYSLRSEPGVVLEVGRRKLLTQGNLFDLIGYSNVKAGNIVDSGALGLDFRLGEGLDTFRPDEISFRKLPEEVPSPWHYYIFTRVEARAIAYNHLLDGSLFQDERHTVTSEPLVGEGQFGVSLGYEKWKLTFTWIILSPEWQENQTFFPFGALDFSW